MTFVAFVGVGVVCYYLGMGIGYVLGWRDHEDQVGR